MVDDEERTADGLSLNVLSVEEMARVQRRIGDLGLDDFVGSRVEVGGGDDLVETTSILQCGDES